MQNNHVNDLEVDVQLLFVKSLYTKRGTLFVGMLSHVLTALLVFHNTNQNSFLYFAVGIFFIWALRMFDMKRFDQVHYENFSLADIQSWERRYVFGAVSISLLLGFMTAYAFTFSNSAFAQLATIAVTFATLIAVVGRNFGSGINVNMMVLAVCLPMLIGFLGSEDIYINILALLLLPIFLSTRTLANNIRNVLYSSVIEQRKSSILASRLDAAINNMSHGLIMVDANQKISVINHNATSMLGLSPNIDLHNRRFGVFLRYMYKNAAFSDKKSTDVKHEISSLVQGEKARIMLETTDNCFLEFSARHQNDNSMVIIFEDVTGKVLADRKILHIARYDALTNIPNRAWFKESINQRLENTSPYAKVGMAVFNIIDFKSVNNTRNHLIGDTLLRSVAKRLKEFMVSRKIIISRFGYDEFHAFFISHDEDTIKQTMQEIFLYMCMPYDIDGDELNINFAAGLVIQNHRESEFENLQICADIALRYARKRGDNIWLIFIPAMAAQYKERNRLKIDLHDAIRKNKLNMVYQPMFTTDGSSIVGAEALSRWQHPELGAISPGIYIPLAEEIGEVTDLTRNMIMNATRDCATWPEHMFVSINLSALDLADHDIITTLYQALKESGLNTNRLHLEITESAIVDKPEQAAMLLQKMRRMGISIAIDDFGTGYSSLSYLGILPINRVKIDRTFVKDITNNNRKLILLRGIADLSRELGLEIVIEGVETHKQLKTICENNCADIIQGFIFGKPMSRSELLKLSRKFWVSSEKAVNNLAPPNMDTINQSHISSYPVVSKINHIKK